MLMGMEAQNGIQIHPDDPVIAIFKSDMNKCLF